MTLRSKFLLPIKAHLKANAKSQRIDLESKSAGREDIDNSFGTVPVLPKAGDCTYVLVLIC